MGHKGQQALQLMCTAVIPSLRGLRTDWEFETRLGYLVRAYLKKSVNRVYQGDRK
jgi:hypothetical protein